MSQSRGRNAGKKAVTAEPSLVDFSDDDISRMSVNELLKAMLDRNSDPIMEKLIYGVISRMPQELADVMEADKRSRSLVISGLEESKSDLAPSVKQQQLENQVTRVLDGLGVECRPVEVYRMGKPTDSRPRLVKLLLPSRSHWKTALSNSYRLRSNPNFSNVFIRKSLTEAERKKEYELRQECRARNKQQNRKVWVVYHGELRRIDELPNSRSSGNVRLDMGHLKA
ncbi:unnamed protein product [Nippostrongylus brasiliensis]|uniref:CUE domain-containing protein n=1 Tax=Nippostrongylus brasiliensis TaxID=27835 RepID=A0A0N4YPF3_NIPBR|nr:unnamed protein product [Nippostrongylus brasiliensis]